MNEFLTMHVEGLKDIERLMRKLPASNQKKIKRGALRAGGAPVRTAMRLEIDRIPTRTGEESTAPTGKISASGKKRLKASIGIVTSKSSAFESKIYVGPRYGGVKNAAPDAHWYEFGTEDRRTKSGKRRGRIKATPFVRPGWDSTKKEAVEITRRELLERTIAEAEKLRKR